MTIVRPESRMTAYASKNGPQRHTRCLLALFVTGLCWQGYGYYNRTLKSDPSVWTSVLQGTASAPEQYRVGVVFTANWMSQHLPLRLSAAFTVLDLVGSLLAVWLLYGLLERSRVYRSASPPLQWFGSAAFLALIFYFLDWNDWYRRVSTLPTVGLVALMLWLWTPPSAGWSSRVRAGWVALAFFVVCMAQALVRADVALLVCLGVVAVCLVRRDPRLALPRWAAMALGLTTAAAVSCVQVYLMRVRYPQASYGDVPVFMLPHDYHRWADWIAFVIFLAPFVWAVVEAARQRWAGEGANVAFLAGALGYAVLWLVLGRLEEVRIFLPFALALTPLTIQLAIRRYHADSAVKPAAEA
jgi:hypothetical protein